MFVVDLSLKEGKEKLLEFIYMFIGGIIKFFFGFVDAGLERWTLCMYGGVCVT